MNGAAPSRSYLIGVSPPATSVSTHCVTPSTANTRNEAYLLPTLFSKSASPSSRHAITLGADKAYDAKDCVNELRSMKVTPHVAQNTSERSSAIDGRTRRHAG